MAKDVRFFVTKRGEGFHGRGQKFLGAAMRRLQRKLRNQATGPYFYAGEPDKKFTLPEIIKDAKQRMATHHIGTRLSLRGSNYDEPSFVIKSRDVTPKEAATITWGKQFVGRSAYHTPGSGPPGSSDCSSFTGNAEKEANGITIAFHADSQYKDARMRRFFDADQLESGDYCFFNYGRLPDGDADHVEFFADHGKNLGSRPSTNGVNYYYWTSNSEPDSSWIAYGRLGA